MSEKALKSEISLTKARELILQCTEIDQLDFYLRFRLEANLRNRNASQSQYQQRHPSR